MEGQKYTCKAPGTLGMMDKKRDLRSHKLRLVSGVDSRWTARMGELVYYLAGVQGSGGGAATGPHCPLGNW